MSDLNARAWRGLAFITAVLALLLCAVAGTVFYWQAWAYLALFGLSCAAITLDLMRRDPALLERRMAAGAVAEKEPAQRVIQTFAQVAFLALYVVAALDHRFAWSHVPLAVVLAAGVLVVAGMAVVFLVFRENTFASATIGVGAEQKVVSTGPYAVVRHPMYSGALLMLLATPPALGSWWGLAAFVPMLVVIVLRLLDEEKVLARDLTGYDAYCRKVRARLVPGIF